MQDDNRDQKREFITIQVTPEFKKKFDELAERNQLATSSYARFLMQREIDDFEQATDLGDKKG